MKSRSIIASLAAVATVASFGATLAFAGPADDAIKGRQACMKSHGGVFGAAMPMIKGEKPFDAAVLKAAFDAEDKACADYGKWWGADTQKGETAETWAKPEIWTDMKGFEAEGGKWFAAGQKLRASASLDDLKANVGGFGEACKGCHEKFRRPKE